MSNTKPLKIGNNEHFHINRVEVFTGEDDYVETECISVEVTNHNKLRVSKVIDHNEACSFRPRFEPGVRLFLKCEDDGADYIVTICHHKGSVLFTSEPETP